MKNSCLLLLWLTLLLHACTKKEASPSSTAELTSFHLFAGQDPHPVPPAGGNIDIRMPDTMVTGQNLIALFTLSKGATAIANGVDQVSGQTQNNFEQDLQYKVVSADGTVQRHWNIRATNNDSTLGWGLGHFVNFSETQDKAYEWYIDQGTTGTCALQNCGPSSVTMAIKWADPAFTGSARDARAACHSSGGWWYTNDVDNYLTDNQVPHAIIALSDQEAQTAAIMANILDKGQILILCIDMNGIRPATDPGFHVDRFYTAAPNWGHFFVVKGYDRVDQALFFEVYDPYSFGYVNTNGSLKGKNRFYRAADLAAASSHWWNYAIVIAPKGQAVSTTALQRDVNPAHIRHAHSL